jgi:hypothetical protein
MNELTRPYVFENLLRGVGRGSFLADFRCPEVQIWAYDSLLQQFCVVEVTFFYLM